MKNFLFLFSALIAVTVLFSFNNNTPVETLNVEEHHTYSCTGSLGGTAFATCTDGSNCSCSSGLFSCSCNCSSPMLAGNQIHSIKRVNENNYRNTEVSSGDKERWTIVYNVLVAQKNEAALKLAQEMSGVYELVHTDKIAYIKKTKQLDGMFSSLPTQIQEEVTEALK